MNAGRNVERKASRGLLVDVMIWNALDLGDVQWMTGARLLDDERQGKKSCVLTYSN